MKLHGYTIDLGTSPRGWFVAGIYRPDGSWASDIEVAGDKTHGFQSREALEAAIKAAGLRETAR